MKPKPRTPKRPRATFLDVNLDLQSPVALDALLSAFGSAVVVLNHHQGEPDWFCSVGLPQTPTGAGDGPADAILSEFCNLVDRLDATARAAWDGCTRRDFNLGFDSWKKTPGSTIHCQASHLSSQTLARIAARGASVTVSVYAWAPWPK